LTEHKATLERVAQELRRHETLDAKQLSQILLETGISLEEVAPVPHAETAAGMHEPGMAPSSTATPNGTLPSLPARPEGLGGTGGMGGINGMSDLGGLGGLGDLGDLGGPGGRRN